MNTSDEPKMSSASAAVGAAGGKQYACLVDGCSSYSTSGGLRGST